MTERETERGSEKTVRRLVKRQSFVTMHLDHLQGHKPSNCSSRPKTFATIGRQKVVADLPYLPVTENIVSDVTPRTTVSMMPGL